MEIENDIMQKKIDDLEKLSEKQATEITELKSLLNDCITRINSLEGGTKTIKDKTSPIPNSLKINATKAKDVQLRKSLVSPRTPVKSARLSGTPTRRSTSDLAKITNQICNQLTHRYVKNSKRPNAWKPPGISLLFCNFNFKNPSNPKKTVLKLNITMKQSTRKPISHNHKEATFVKGEGLLRLFIKGRPINLCAPTSLAGEFNIKSPATEPDENLRMEWVYGYRGKDCRKNIYYLPTGDLVYFVAGIIVLHNLKTEIQRHYVEHTDDVKCLALHPDKVTFASGQVAGHSKVEGKPHVRIWSSLSLQTLHIIGLGFFERAVSALDFSKSDGGKLLCTVDDANDHNLTVWNWSAAKSVSTSKSSTEAVIEIEFNPVDSNVIVSCGKNHLAFWTIEKSGLVKKMAIFEKYEKPKFITCAIFSSTGELITGDSSGNIFFWSREKRQITSAISQAHSGPIFSLHINDKGSLLSGGGKDHAIFEWDLSSKEKMERTITIPSDYGHCRTLSELNNKLIVGTTNNGILEVTDDGEVVDILNGHFDEVWALANHPTKEQFVSAGYDHKIIVWDALSHNIVISKKIEKAVQSICINETADLVVFGCNDGHWMIYNLENLEQIHQSQDGNEPIQCCEFSPDGSHLALGSRDNFIYVYKVSDSASEVTKAGKCSGHSSFITHLDWTTDGQYLRSNSGDYEVLFWNATDCKQLTTASALADASWNTCNCALAFEVAGIWPEGSDGTDINAVTKAHNKSLIATADDFGKVNLYRYPACAPKSAHKIYRGHSSHVTSVKFLVDDRRLTSTGGQDTAIVQWVLA